MANPTLNINSTGVRDMKYNGSAASATNSWSDNEVVDIYYDGTKYVASTHGGAQFSTGENVGDVGIVNDLATGGVNNVLSAEQGKIISYPSYSGAYKKYINAVSGTEHSSSDDKIFVNIKEGTNFRVILKSSSNSTLYATYDDDSSEQINQFGQNSSKNLIASHNIVSLGIYFSATTTEVVEFSVLVDLMSSVKNSMNLNKGILLKGSNVGKITYNSSGVTLPNGLVIRYSSLNGQYSSYVLSSDVTISYFTGGYKQQVLLDYVNSTFYTATYDNSGVIKENSVYLFSLDYNAKTSDLPIDLDGSGITQESIGTLQSSVSNLNSLTYSVNKLTDSPIALNARVVIFNNLKFYKGLKYKFTIDITYDVSRAHTINISGIYKNTAYGTSISATYSVTTISVTSTHVEGYFIPNETFEGNGCFVLADYSYSASNKQYASVTLIAESTNQAINNLDDRVGSLENGMENSFVGRTLEQMKKVRQLGYALKTSMSSPYVPVGYIPQLSFMHISDTHGGTDDSHKVNSENAIKALNLLSTGTSNYGNQVKFLIHTGDIKDHAFDSNFSYWTSARALATKPVYHVIGNHDVGFQKAVADAGTDAQVYNVMISPFLSEWQLKTDGLGTPHPTDKNYYFTDFTDEKIRLIVLYEYETEFELDPNDNTQLLYARGYRAFRQAQIDWFIESLMTTPAGYGVIVAKHQMEDYNDGNVNPFNSPLRKDITGQSMTFVPVYMIADIVEAFRNGTSINETYAQTGGCSTSYPTLSAVADFSNKNTGVEFICYLSGHTHSDEVHYVRKYPNQLELTIGCDNTTYTAYSDMNQIIDTLSQDVINVYAIDRNIGVVNIVRIGSNLSNTMQKRDVLSIKYKT